MKLQRIDEVEHVEVGRMYLVPCSYGAWGPFSDTERRWWPVMGSWHEDRQHIGFDVMHYHLDPRFLSDSVLRRADSVRGTYWSVFSTPLQTLFNWSEKTGIVPSDIEYRRRKCQREMPRHPAIVARGYGFKELEKAFKGKRLVDGRCPHKGFDLRSMPVRDDGCTECPLHGLRFRDGVCVS